MILRFTRDGKAGKAIQKRFERLSQSAVYILWLRRFGWWHALVFEFLRGVPCPDLFFLVALFHPRSSRNVHLLGLSARDSLE